MSPVSTRARIRSSRGKASLTAVVSTSNGMGRPDATEGIDSWSSLKGATSGFWWKIAAVLCHTVCVCVVVSFILDVWLVDMPAEVTQEEGHTGFFIHLPSAVLALIFLESRIQPFLSLGDREVEFCVLTN